MIDISRIDLESIKSDQPRSNFNEGDLERLAEAILQSGGLVKPVVLKQTGFNQYELIDGYLEYYAAVRAFEKDDAESEVNAIVVSPEDLDFAKQQLDGIYSVSTPVAISGKQPTPQPTNLESRLANLELRLERQISDIKSEQLQERRKLEAKIEELEQRLPKPIAPIEALNTFNEAQLTAKLGSSVPNKVIANIVNERKKNGDFQKCSEVVDRVKGLAERRMITIVDAFSTN